jgi:hypothetical protein
MCKSRSGTEEICVARFVPGTCVLMLLRVSTSISDGVALNKASGPEDLAQTE